MQDISKKVAGHRLIIFAGYVLHQKKKLLSYFFVLVTKPSVAHLPLYQDVTARNLHIFSPGYPDPMPKGTHNFQCVVTPVGYL